MKRAKRQNVPAAIEFKTVSLHKSLLAAVRRAGGAELEFSWFRLNNMTAAELLTSIAPNRIYFRYRKPEVKNEKSQS